eukprot:s3056_g2.t1
MKLSGCLVNEVTSQVANSEQELMDRFMGKLLSGDPVIEMELQGALLAKDEKFTARDQPSIAAILNDLDVAKPGQSSSVELQSALEVSQQRMTSQQFELCMGELDYDCKSFRVFQRKVKEYNLRVLHQRDSWQIDRHSAAKQAAISILEKKAGH